MIGRQQLPAYSPLRARALLRGALSALGADASRAVLSSVRERWHARSVLLTSSGTSALSLALRASAAGEPLVALPAYGCYDLATAAEGADARVVLYDVDPATLAPEPASLQRALERAPAALVLVHLYGLPVDVPALRRAAPGVLVVEDAAQGIGATLLGRPVGSFGPLAVLSFGRGKGLTGGSGGALLANDEAGADRLAGLAALMSGAGAGWGDLVKSSVQWVLGRPGLYALPSALPFLRLGETVYHAPTPAGGLSRAAAGMLLQNWDASLAAATRRHSHAGRLLAAARAAGQWEVVTVAPGAVPGYLRLPLLAPRGQRSVLLSERARALGIMQGYPLPLWKLARFAGRCVNASDNFAGANRLASDLITLPTHTLLRERDLASLEQWLASPAG